MLIRHLQQALIMQVVMMFDSSDMLNNIRMLAVYGDENYGFLNYSYVLNQVLLVVGLWRYPKVPLWQLITIIIASLMSAFAIMEKGMLFFLFAGVLFVLYEKRVIKMRSILISSAVLILVFFLFTTEPNRLLKPLLLRMGPAFPHRPAIPQMIPQGAQTDTNRATETQTPNHHKPSKTLKTQQKRGSRTKSETPQTQPTGLYA